MSLSTARRQCCMPDGWIHSGEDSWMNKVLCRRTHILNKAWMHMHHHYCRYRKSISTVPGDSSHGFKPLKYKPTLWVAGHSWTSLRNQVIIQLQHEELYQVTLLNASLIVGLQTSCIFILGLANSQPTDPAKGLSVWCSIANLRKSCVEHHDKLPDSSRSHPTQVLFPGQTSSVQALGLHTSLQEQFGAPAGTKAGAWLPEAGLLPDSVCRMCSASHLPGAATCQRPWQDLSGD